MHLKLSNILKLIQKNHQMMSSSHFRLGDAESFVNDL